MTWCESDSADRSQRDLFLRREAMLLPADLALVLGGRLVELEAAVERVVGEALFVGLPLRRVHRREVSCDLEVLTEHLQRVDPGDGRADRKAHRIAQRIARPAPPFS